MRKRVLSVVLSIVLLVSAATMFSSCGSDNDGKKSEKNTPVPVEELAKTTKNDEYEYDVYKTYVEIIGYIGKAEDVTVPDKIDDLPVYSIGLYAFSNNESLKTIKLPTTLKNIADTAFYNCTKLTQVTLSDQLYAIGDNAFANCELLKSISLPEGLCKIGTNAFGGCYALETLTIPSSIEEIDGGAFSYTKWLDNQKEEFLIAGDGILVAYLGQSEEVTVPDNVKQVAGFFDCSGITKITLPKGVKTLCNSAFNNCTVSEVVFSDTVTDIGKNAFANCQNLKTIELPSSLTEIGSTAFTGCSALERIVIPKSVKSIGDNAFLRCVKLENVIFSSDELTIGTQIFESCDNVKVMARKNTSAHKYALENNYKFVELK